MNVQLLRGLLLSGLVLSAAACSGGSSGSSSSTAAAVTSGQSAATQSASGSSTTSASAAAPSSAGGATAFRAPTLSATSLSETFNDRAATTELTGSGFYPGAQVRLVGTAGTFPASTVDVLAESRIEATFAAGVPAGSYEIEVESRGGQVRALTFEVENLLDVDQPGALLIGYEDGTMAGASGDQVDVRVYYPGLTRGRAVAADPAGAPYPIVVFSHGFKPFLLSAGIDYRNNTFLVEHLVSLGYVVICPDLSSNNQYFGSGATGQQNSERDGEDALAALDHVIGLGRDANHPLFSLVDEDTAGLVGHSRGADGSLIAAADEVTARGAQARVKAVAAMAPPATDSQNGNAPLQFGDFSSVPTLLIGATEDSIAPFSAQQSILALAGAPSWAFEIVGGNHSQYKDSASRLLGDGTATLPLADQQAICRRYVTAWLHRHVKGLDLPLVNERILQGSEVQADARIQGLSVR